MCNASTIPCPPPTFDELPDEEPLPADACWRCEGTGARLTREASWAEPEEWDACVFCDGTGVET
jgi:hypothetical protein